MSDVRLESRIAEANAAARLLGDAPGVLTLAVAAFAEACPRGLVLGFMQRADGSVGPVAAMRELMRLVRGCAKTSICWPSSALVATDSRER